MKTCVIAVLSILLSLQVLSQTIITGTVSGKDGSIPGASVYLEGTYDGASTNEKVEFSFIYSFHPDLYPHTCLDQ
ncbi:MAG: hypothetical protein WC780_11245 [Lentimicrobiaceae bacterium]|jgi:hypothetical protein